MESGLNIAPVKNMGFKKLIIRRVILTVPVAIGVVTIIFAALSVMTPTMRVAYFAGGSPRDFGPENMKRLLHQYGLDRPILVQYADWLGKVIRLDFGRSMSSGAPAMEVVLGSLPPTLELVLYSAPLIILFGFWLGTKAALNHNKTVDHVARIIGTLGTSFPVFVTAGLLIMLSLVVQNPRHLYFIPTGQLGYFKGIDHNLKVANGTFTDYTGMMTIDALINGDMPIFLDAVTHLVLPVVVLVFTQCAALMRLTRSGLIEESGKPYFYSAMTKGLSKKEALYRHARKNALISVLTLSGLLLGNMLMGLAVVEIVFGRPGFASLVASVARTMDAPVMCACATFVALVFVLINLVIDILYVYVNPKVKLF